MGIHPYLEELERTQAFPAVTFDWRDPKDPKKWHETIYDVISYLKEKGRTSGVLIMPDGSGYQNRFAEYYAFAASALAKVVLHSPPCEGRELRSRVLTVVEQTRPNEDDIHGEVMARLNEATYKTVRKTRDLWMAKGAPGDDS